MVHLIQLQVNRQEPVNPIPGLELFSVCIIVLEMGVSSEVAKHSYDMELCKESRAQKLVRTARI